MKAYVYSNGEFLGCVLPCEDDFRQDTVNWRSAALNAAKRVFGEGTYHVTSAPYETD